MITYYLRALPGSDASRQLVKVVLYIVCKITSSV